MQLFKHFQLVLVLLLMTDIVSLDYKLHHSVMFAEGTCPRKKCWLQKCASDNLGSKRTCPIRLSSCGVKERSCGDQPSCQRKESSECPFCGGESCPQQQKPSGCSGKGNSCPQQKSPCSNQKGSCPQAKPKCPSAPQPKCPPPPKPKCPPPPKPKCPPPPKPKCPPPPEPKCPSQPKPVCPHQQKPTCPERCSVFGKFSFPSIINVKPQPPVAEHKSDKCGTSCPGGAACKGKPATK